MNPLAAALSWTLVHFLWQGALIALALAAGLRLMPRGSARFRYNAACVAMLALPVVFAATLVVFYVPASPQPIILPGALLARAASPDMLLAQAPAPADRWHPPAWTVSVWLAGVALVYLYATAAWFAARRLRRTGVCKPPVEWQERLVRLAERLGVSRAIVLLESCLVEVPVVIGWLRPVILVPAGLFTAMPSQQIEFLLLHELAHIRRNDYLVRLIEKLVQGLLFYHPAVWWISGVLRAERENCCDDLVVSMTADAPGYAAVLVALENSRPPFGEPALAATGGHLVRRIRRLLGQPEQPAPVLSLGLLILLASAAFAAWQTKPAPTRSLVTQPVVTPPAVTAPKATPTPRLIAQAKPQAPAAQPDSPYDLWLKEDVAYIITDAERTAFRALGSDPEREHFIEQFWQRRDPTPGTPENEMKEEHYRRIAYTNGRFADGRVAGWKTDRGRIYIVFGPPDELEDTTGTATTPPFQKWRYKFIDGIGSDVIIEFVDSGRTGEYRQTADPRNQLLAPRASNVYGVSVEVSPDRLATITVPLQAGSGQATVTLRVSSNVAVLQNELAELRLQLWNLGQKYTPEHPAVKELRVKISFLEFELARLTSPGNVVFVDERVTESTAVTHIPLGPGSYFLTAIVKNIASGATSQSTLSFEVK